jgi:hypothetical protein
MQATTTRGQLIKPTAPPVETFAPGMRVRWVKQRETGVFLRYNADGQALVLLPGDHKPTALDPAWLVRHRNITRTWTIRGRLTRVNVATAHRNYPGDPLDRGTIHRTRDGGWQPIDPDHNHLPVVAGDYLDAERALFAATPDLDEPPTVVDEAALYGDAFRRHARQFQQFADEYRPVVNDPIKAAAWANRGFMPGEAKPWIAAGFDPDMAARYADRFISPVEALARAN